MSTATLVAGFVTVLCSIVFFVDMTRFLLGVFSVPVGLDSGQFKPGTSRRFLKHAAVAFIIGMFCLLILLALQGVPYMAEGHDVIILLIMGWPFMSTILVGILYTTLLHDTCARCGHPLGLQRQDIVVKEKMVKEKMDVQWNCKFCRHTIWRVELADDFRWGDAKVPGLVSALIVLSLQYINPGPWPLMILIWGFLTVILLVKFKGFQMGDGGDGGDGGE